MSTQILFAQEPQTPFCFAEDPQSPIAFPLSLTEKYQPRRLEDLIGLAAPRRVLDALIKAPRPCSMLFVGNPGVGKTIAGMCFADTLGGSLVHLASQKCDVATLDSLRDRFAYHPPQGKFWVCLVDEADQMSEKAQVQFLSRLDATASLITVFGGASVRKSQPPIIWIFTANGLGPQGTVPPSSLEKRFLSRCMVIPFEPLAEHELSEYLRSIWTKETDDEAEPAYFDYLARGGEIRESMMKMQVDLLTGAPRPVPAAEPSLHAPVTVPCTCDKSGYCQRHCIHVPAAKVPKKAAPEPNPAGRYVPQWRRIYAGPAGEQLNRVVRLLAAHSIEALARDDRSNAQVRAQKLQCVLVARNDYLEAKTLLLKMKA